ncbi:MAG: ABC transporter substrate-binding protein [Planctomycetota bacterium]
MTEATGDAADTVTGIDEPFVLGDLLEPFEAPATLEDVDRLAVEWIDSPVVDPLERRRQQQQAVAPPSDPEAALALRNVSDEANAQILAARSVLAPADGVGVDYSATLNRTLQQDLRSLNTLLASSVAESEVSSLTEFNLFGFDSEFIPFANADHVVSWQTSKDRMYDKVVMRDDLLWSDGTPITAHDVEFTFRVLMSSKVPVPAQRQGTDQHRAIKAYDDHTLVYFHSQPLATNVWNMNFTIVPKHVFEETIAEDPTLRTSEAHNAFERKPVVGGPYEVLRRTRGSELLLERRENYYLVNGERVREKPHFARVRHRIIEDQNTQLLALKSGDVDETLLGAEQWTTQTIDDNFYRTNTKARAVRWLYFYINWNQKNPLFQDVRVRHALAHAMNYGEMIDDLCYGLYPRCNGVFHPSAWMFPKDPRPAFDYDLDAAEDLLDEAGWGDSDGDGMRDKEIGGRVMPFEFSLLVSNKPDRIAICNLFRESLESIGIRCNITPLEAAVFQERVFKKNFQAQMSGWGTSTDPYSNRNIFGTGEDRNYGGYSNAEVDRLFDAGEVEFDREKRAEIYGKIYNLISEDQPYLFLYYRSSFYGFSNDLRGYRFSPRGPFGYDGSLGSLWTPAAN